MKRHRLIVAILVCITSLSTWGAGASPGRDRISTSSPVWLPDSSALLFLRQVVRMDPLKKSVLPGSSHLFLVGADGRGIRPIGAITADGTVFHGGLVLVPSNAELWTMEAGRPETIQVLWGAPSGHLLCDARYAKQTADFLTLTYSQGTFTLWSVDGRGSTTASRPLKAGTRYAWSKEGHRLLIGGPDGLWAIDTTGPDEPRPIAAGEPAGFGFSDRAPDHAFYQLGGEWFMIGLNEGAAARPAGAEFDPASHPLQFARSPGALPAPVSFASPGPSGELLVSDGDTLQSLSIATGFTQTLADTVPEGRNSWVSGGETMAFSSRGNLFFYHTRAGKIEQAGAGLDPMFSPRGDQLVFWRQQSGSPRIVVRGFPNGREWLSVAGKQPVWLTYRELACVIKQRDNWQVAVVSLKDGTAKPITSLSLFTVQLAAFPTAAEAQVFAERLPAGFPAVCLQETDAKGKRWYRVRAGTFLTVAQAEAAFNKALPQLKDMPGWNGSHMIAPALNEFGWLWPTPDGTALVFEAMGSIYHYDFKKAALKALWRPEALSMLPERDVALSPDGGRIAFVDEQGRLNVMPVGGGKPTVVCGAPEI